MEYPASQWELGEWPNGTIGFFTTKDANLKDFETMVILVIAMEGEDTVEDILKEYTSVEESGMSIKQFEQAFPSKSFEFLKRNFGNNSFYYINNYLFEGQYGVRYYTVDDKNSRIIEFMLRGFTRSGKNWTDSDYNADDEPDHRILKQILSTFRFVELTSQAQWNWGFLGCGSNTPCSYNVCSVSDPANCYSCAGKYDSINRGEKTPNWTTDPRTTTDFICKKDASTQ
ncbi:MAG: hypothetical protein AAB600_02440 [Patescibacteria group bacterium]